MTGTEQTPTLAAPPAEHRIAADDACSGSAHGPGDEAQLLRSLRDGDRSAFEFLVRSHGNYLYNAARRITGDDAEARDAVQDALLAALRHFDDFEGRSSLRTWLYRLAVNATLMRMRTRRRRHEVSIEELVEPVTGIREEPEWHFAESAEASIARNEVRTAVRAGIDQLGDKYREVLILRDIQGHDTREVAALLGETEANIKVRLHRARAALKKALEPLYREQSP
ncbi:MAG: sigma-70 family RNA polymerase sigma factor [Gammaproteobacteria bacterium]|nr:sigma-70 family RNA polymerase sigma factor [Gammaproteobacteria bacterium]